MKKCIVPFIMLFLVLFTSFGCTSEIEKNNQYTNEKYDFSVFVPTDWILYRQGMALNPERWCIDWGLPKIWSTKENTHIENSVSISVLKEEIASIDELVKIELQRIKDIIVSQKKNDLPDGNTSIITITKINGLLYKSRTDFFLSNNKGFVITFTATKGTYKINLLKFENFIKSLTFNK